MKPLYSGPPMAWRSPLSSNPDAVREALAYVPAFEIVSRLVDEWEQAEGTRVAAACRSYDLDGPPHIDSDAARWMRAQMARRAAFLRDRVLPLFQEAGHSLTMRQVEEWLAAASALAA